MNMRDNKRGLYALGIDTSNYKTSVAIVGSDGDVVCNLQQYLRVKKGERGLRQSDALFQHITGLPALVEKAFSLCSGEKIGCISVSEKPRPVEGSYMPVFNAGVSAGRELAAALSVPLFRFSHQEGHIEAVRYNSDFKNKDRFISFHFSGGTTEALLVSADGIELIGGSLDLSFGQVLDRTGVAMGMKFPCGEEMDLLMQDFTPEESNRLCKIKIKDGRFNLSGIETQCQRLCGTVDNRELTYMVFERLAETVCGLCTDLRNRYEINDFLFAGGVSSSRFMRNVIKKQLSDFSVCFGDPALSTDNAVGTAFLGGKKIWQENL